jgi:hypothetical protein
MEEKKDFQIPQHIIDLYVKKYGEYPCITQTRNVTYSAIDLLLKKNKLFWFFNFFDGNENNLKSGLIDYNEMYKIMIFVSNIENEKTYKLYIFSNTDSKLNVDLLTKGLNKFYTIDMI